MQWSQKANLGMLRTDISENKIVYSCCDLETPIPDRYSFSVEWHQCDK